MPRLVIAAASFVLSVLPIAPAAAQAPADTVSAADDTKAPQDAPERLLRFRDSVVSWEHNVSAETLGVGADVQSSNPTYIMGLAARGRFYLVDERKDKLFVLGNIGLYRELTNSDSTTAQGEVSLSDAELALVYAPRLRGSGEGDATLADVRASLTLPTSKSSYESGRYFAPGVGVGITQVTPLLKGRVEPDISSIVRLAVAYQRWFARATVPTNPSLERVRMTMDGRTLPGDQLSGSSLIRDQLTFSTRFTLAFGEVVGWATDFGLQPAWKYDVQDQVQVCGNVLTGCTTVQVGEDDSRYLVRTLFNTEVAFHFMRGFSLEVGYGNVANQIGPNGHRRGIFYSPDAGFYASLSLIPHELFTSPEPERKAQSSAAPHRL
ncbi:MAG TPA: hypothetical protein VIW29_14915 [Polyangiaceae bacterium]